MTGVDARGRGAVRLGHMAHILLVDDDEAMRRVLRKMFERAGHQVSDADSADQALLLIDGPAAPDAVVSDVLMPGIDGLAFYRQLAARAPHLRNRVVFLSGASTEPEVHEAIELLGVPLLGKLGDLNLVVDAVAIALLKRARA